MLDRWSVNRLVTHCILQRLLPHDDVPHKPERRKSRRWQVFNQFVYLYHHDIEYCVRIRDISLSGMRVESAPETLPVGAQVQIVTTLGRHGVLETLCEVIHVSEVAGFRYAGLQFTPRDPEELEPLRLYLDSE